jgi:hypothetical protein
MNIIKTPDKIILDRVAIEKIVREHIQNTTGRTARPNVCYSHLPLDNSVTNFQLTFELAEIVVKSPAFLDTEWPNDPGHTYKSPGVVPAPWPYATPPSPDANIEGSKLYIGPSAARTELVKKMAESSINMRSEGYEDHQDPIGREFK